MWLNILIGAVAGLIVIAIGLRLSTAKTLTAKVNIWETISAVAGAAAAIAAVIAIYQTNQLAERQARLQGAQFVVKSINITAVPEKDICLVNIVFGNNGGRVAEKLAWASIRHGKAITTDSLNIRSNAMFNSVPPTEEVNLGFKTPAFSKDEQSVYFPLMLSYVDQYHGTRVQQFFYYKMQYAATTDSWSWVNATLDETRNFEPIIKPLLEEGIRRALPQ